MSQDNSEQISSNPLESRFSQTMAEFNALQKQGQTIPDAQQKPQEQKSLLEDFGRSLLHSGAQTPINALVQPFDRALGTNILPHIQFVDAPAPTQFGTSNYWAQQGGSAVGMLGTFWLAGKGVKAFTRAGQTEAMLANTLSRQSQIGLTMKEAAYTGLAHDFLFRPVEEGDKRNYLVARLSNGAIGGATMLTLAGTGVGLKHLGGMASVERSAALPLGQNAFGRMISTSADKLRLNVAAPLLKNDIAGGVISALPAGLLSVNLHTKFKDDRWATAQENFESVVTMGVLGGAFGAHQHFRGRFESGRKNFDWIGQQPSEHGKTTADFKVVGGQKALTEAIEKVRSGEGAMVKVREHLGQATGWRRYLGMQEYGPQKNLFVQHNDATKGINFDAAKMADILAICNLDAALQGKSAVTGDNLTMRAGRDRMRISSEPQELRKGESKPIPLGDRTQNFADNMNNLRSNAHNVGEESSVNDIVRQQLKATGLEEKGWRSTVTEKDSLMDKVGADIVLYNEKTGQMYMLDCTEQSKNPPAIRAAGIIEIQKSWFRASGNGPDMPSNFPEKVGDILLNVTGESSGVAPPLNLKDVTLPSIKVASDVEQLTQMRQFVRDLERVPSDPHFRGNKRMIDEYAHKLQETTLDHLEWTVHGTPNRSVTRSAVDVAKETVVDYFLGKRDVNPNLGNTDVYVKHDFLEPQNHELRFRSSYGDRIQVGKMEAILEQARKEMLPLNGERAKQVEANMEAHRAKVKTQEAIIENIKEKRQKAQTWEDLQSYNAELQQAREQHQAAVEAMRPWTPENSLLQRLKKAGKTVQEFQSFLMQHQAEIRNGGRVGSVDPHKPGAIEQALKNNLSQKPEEFLLRTAGPLERPLKPFEEAGVSAVTAKELIAEIHKEMGIPELKPGQVHEDVALSLMILAEKNPTVSKLADGYERGIPEAIRVVHRLLTER
ncbi:MAG: hypothetical protein C0507_20110 [Cyanobacteria bacterium PR.3.49]|nr:hypothetical protein [Cyanobacteria bacterium PR.3.49]